jgi:hypothetical protein
MMCQYWLEVVEIGCGNLFAEGTNFRARSGRLSHNCNITDTRAIILAHDCKLGLGPKNIQERDELRSFKALICLLSSDASVNSNLCSDALLKVRCLGTLLLGQKKQTNLLLSRMSRHETAVKMAKEKPGHLAERVATVGAFVFGMNNVKSCDACSAKGKRGD